MKTVFWIAAWFFASLIAGGMFCLLVSTADADRAMQTLMDEYEKKEKPKETEKGEGIHGSL